jgi:MFS transporter, OFA family, oxalate/formate antiporter
VSSSSTLYASLPNRWVIAISAFIMQLALGAVYAWSVFLNPVIKDYHVSKPEANLTFSVALLALGVTTGAAVISVASPLAQKFTGVSAGVASIIVILISIFNGVGRLFWAWLSDAIGRPFTFLSIFIVEIIVFALMPSITTFAILLIPAAIVGLCYGGGFGTMPAFAADSFGPKYAGTIYGAMLTAWSAGGIVGPLLIASIDYKTALYILAVVMVVAALLPLLSRYLARRRGDIPVPA